MEQEINIRDFDYFTFAVILILSVVGTIMIYASTMDGLQSGLYIRQTAWILIGIAGLFAVLAIPYYIIVEWGYLFYALSITSLVFVLIAGKAVAGSRAWFAVGPFQIQPSEFAKIAILLAIGAYVNNPNFTGTEIKDLIKLLSLVFIPMILILMEPDLGTATTLLPIAFCVIWFSNIPLKRLIVIGLIGIIGFFIFSGMAWQFTLKDYQKKRIECFINPDLDPKGSGYQVRQAKIAVGSGGLFGKGIGSGTQSRLAFLPQPHTDFIFGVLAENLGFVGATIVLLLYVLLILRTIQTASLTRDFSGFLISTSLALMLLYHLIVNIGMVLGLVPTTGIPLPLMSYGGSSMISTLFLFGIVVNIRLRRFVN